MAKTLSELSRSLSTISELLYSAWGNNYRYFYGKLRNVSP